MHIPFLDLKAHHEPLRRELDAAIADVIDRSAFSGGSCVTRFENDFAAFCGCPYAVGVGSGTEALWFALAAVGVGPGDEVITVPHTFVATVEAIQLTGARPVLVDIDERTYTMDPACLAQAITPLTKAIIPVHIFGQTANMDPILEIARRHRLHVIEDACQAHGATYQGRMAGSMGLAGCFSFYPGKNLGALGEAGAVVTHSSEIRDTLHKLRDHGQSAKYRHTRVGWNGRMDGIQGAVLQVKLRHLERWNAARRDHAAAYQRLLDSVPGVTLPHDAGWGKHIYHVYAVRVQNRDLALGGMAARGISCGIHYPIPVHLQEAYCSLGYPEGSFPVAERCAREFLSLPMYPELTADQVKTITSEFKRLVESCGEMLARRA